MNLKEIARNLRSKRVNDGFHTNTNPDTELSKDLMSKFDWLVGDCDIEYYSKSRIITWYDKRNREQVCTICESTGRKGAYKDLINYEYSYATDEELADEKKVIEYLNQRGLKKIDKKKHFGKRRTDW